MTSVTEIHLTPGDLLYREGDTNDCAYIIGTGEVILFTERSGKRADIERRGVGAIIGELSILTGKPRAVTVEALTSCTLYEIQAEQILRRFEKLDPILRACVETSILFTAAFNMQGVDTTAGVPVAPNTLRNATEIVNQFRLEADLKRGLDQGEFSMVYQPIVQISEGNIVGFEALMRWQHATLGNVLPDRFIQVAESMGSIDLITNFAILETCAALKRIKASNAVAKGFYASINVSGQDIGRYGFFDFLSFVLESNDLDPWDIRLEVTETAIIDDFETADRNLDRIRSIGCGISIDDFGTGYSNLAYLKSLPLTALKIDRTFAGDAHSSAVSRSIVKMLLSLGNDLCVDIIAEGLETIDDVETLQALGCRFAQGYYFYRPVCEAELIRVIAGNKRDQHAA